MSTVAPPIPPDPLKQTARIAVMVADGLSPFHLAVPWLVFGEDRAAIGAPGYEVRLCAEGDSAVHLSMGLQVETFGGLAELAGADLVVTGEGLLDDQSVDGKVVGGVLDMAHEFGVEAMVVCGSVDAGDWDRSLLDGVEVVSLADAFGLDAAMSDTVSLVGRVVSDALSARGGRR